MIHGRATHADLSAGVRYLLTSALSLEGGYRFTYFVQHERSHEDGNYFQLFDNGLSVALAYRF